jgi:hypothetical protein
MLGSAVVGGVLASIAQDNTILLILGCVFTLAAAVIGIIDIHKLSKSFGHGVGFTLGLIFLSPIFTLILGFGSSEYIGPDVEEEYE